MDVTCQCGHVKALHSRRVGQGTNSACLAEECRCIWFHRPKSMDVAEALDDVRCGREDCTEVPLRVKMEGCNVTEMQGWEPCLHCAVAREAVKRERKRVERALKAGIETTIEQLPSGLLSSRAVDEGIRRLHSDVLRIVRGAK
jgi:hypothetical protein